MVANGLGYSLANVRPRADVALDGRRVYRVALAGDPPPLRIGIATLKELKKDALGRGVRAPLPGAHFGNLHSGHGGGERGAPPRADAAALMAVRADAQRIRVGKRNDSCR